MQPPLLSTCKRPPAATNQSNQRIQYVWHGFNIWLNRYRIEEGYTGDMVITEYVTKFPYAVSIKTKSSAEITEKLFEYVSLFGPPRNRVSDQGREFMGLCTNFSNIIGTEHKVTAAYNPRTNGLTERFNLTFCDALRKHAEADPSQWHKWLPYVLMTYRRRIHSITK